MIMYIYRLGFVCLFLGLCSGCHLSLFEEKKEELGIAIDFIDEYTIKYGKLPEARVFESWQVSQIDGQNIVYVPYAGKSIQPFYVLNVLGDREFQYDSRDGSIRLKEVPGDNSGLDAAKKYIDDYVKKHGYLPSVLEFDVWNLDNPDKGVSYYKAFNLSDDTYYIVVGYVLPDPDDYRSLKTIKFDSRLDRSAP